MAEQNNQIITAEQEKEETRELRRKQSMERTILRQETKEKTKEEEVKKEETPGVKKGISLFTAQALRTCWGLIVTTGGIIGGLAGLAYINLHFVAKYILGLSFFCDFGEEWLSPTSAGQTIGSKISGGTIKWFELIALFCLDLFVLVLILIAVILIITPIVMIAGALSGVAGSVGL